jgi:hypothetical protein
MLNTENTPKETDELVRLNDCPVEAAILEKRGRFFIIVVFEPAAPRDSCYLTAEWYVGDSHWSQGDYGFPSYDDALAAAIVRANREL